MTRSSSAAPFLALLVLSACGSTPTQAGKHDSNTNATTGGTNGDASGGSSTISAGGSMGGTGASGGGSVTGGSGGTAPVTINDGCSWVDVSQGHHAFYVGAAPHENRIYLPDSNEKKLYVSSDNGDSWTALAGTGDKAFDAIIEKIVFDPADTTDNTFWAGGMYGAAGVYHTTDGGQTFSSTCFEHLDAFSVDLTDPEHKSMLASGHGGTPYISLDGGATCSPLLPKLQAGDAGVASGWVPYVIDATTFLISSGGYGGTEGIWRSTDSGNTWNLVAEQSVGQDLVIGLDGTYVYNQFWNRGLLVSNDKGETWQSTVGYGTLESGFGVTGTFIGDGRFVNIKATSKSGMEQLMVSSDYTTFTDFLAPFPASAPGDGSIIGVLYSAPGNRLYTYSNQSGNLSRCDL